MLEAPAFTSTKPLLALVLAVATPFVLLACAADDPFEGARSRAAGQRNADASVPDARVPADVALPPRGVLDRGRTSALLLLEVGRSPRCGAVLVASNLALAPTACLRRSSSCQVHPVGKLVVRSGDDRRDFVAGVRETVTVDACDDESLTALVLTHHADGLAPLAIRARPGAAGELVRAAVFSGAHTAGLAQRIIRDHLRLEEASKATVRVPGDACASLAGGAAIDESTGELVALGALGARDVDAACDQLGALYLQVDAARRLVERALARAAETSSVDGGPSAAAEDAGPPRRGKPAKLTTDLGEPCEDALGCAAGVCLFDLGAGYCSRPCAPGDRCPSGMRCERFGAITACASSR